MNNIGQINDRKIIYLSIKKTENWVDILPEKNWLVLAVCDDRDTELLDKVAKACLDKNVLYVCAVGRECEWAHDWFDETILINRIEKELPVSSPEDFEEEPMTTWHNDFDEGFWFASSAAYPSVHDGYIHVDTVICLDLTDSSKEQYLAELIFKINSGWLPSDDED